MDPISVLGIIVADEKAKILELNYQPVIKKMEGILKKWAKSNLSLLGKITVVNTLIASLFVYKLMVLPEMSEGLIKQTEQIVQTFVWNARRPKIPMHVLQLGKSSGGQKLMNLKAKERILKATWVSILVREPSLSRLVYSNMKITMGQVFWKCNLKPDDVGKVSPETFDNFSDYGCKVLVWPTDE